MSEVESCRLCCSTVIVSQHNFRMVFSTECLKVDFAGRLSRLLDLPVLQSDGLSEYLCRSCLRKVDSLEALSVLHDRATRNNEADTLQSCKVGQVKKDLRTQVGMKPHLTLSSLAR